MKPFALAAVAAFFMSVANAASTFIRVDLYQVTPEGIAVYLGERQVPIQPDIIEAVPGISSMYCQLYVKDHNLNGIPEAPAMLSCLDAEGGQHILPVEMDGMENPHRET